MKIHKIVVEIVSAFVLIYTSVLLLNSFRQARVFR